MIRKLMAKKTVVILLTYVTAMLFCSVVMIGLLINPILGAILLWAYLIIPVVVLFFSIKFRKQQNKRFLTYSITFIVSCFVGPAVTYAVVFYLVWFVFGIPLFPGAS